jgi:hypothetical protein
MSKYLTHAATLTCNHQGAVQLPPNERTTFRSNGSPVVTVEDLLQSASVVGCTQGGPGRKPCTRIQQVLVGKAQNVKTDEKEVLLVTLRAVTDGVPPGIVTVTSDAGPLARTGGLGIDWTNPPDHWIAVELVDDHGVPIANQHFSVEDGDGPPIDGYLDEQGRGFLVLTSGGRHNVSFPEIDGESWRLVASRSGRPDE